MFEKGLNIELDREELSESINLYNVDGVYEWSIIWNEHSGKDTYYCNIVSSNGEINSIGYNFGKQLYSNETVDIEKHESLKQLIKPLADELGINILESRLYIKNNIIIIQDGNSEGEYSHEFMIDVNNQKVMYYQRTKINNKSIEIRSADEYTSSRG